MWSLYVLIGVSTEPPQPTVDPSCNRNAQVARNVFNKFYYLVSTARCLLRCLRLSCIPFACILPTLVFPTSRCRLCYYFPTWVLFTCNIFDFGFWLPIGLSVVYLFWCSAIAKKNNSSSTRSDRSIATPRLPETDCARYPFSVTLVIWGLANRIEKITFELLLRITRAVRAMAQASSRGLDS